MVRPILVTGSGGFVARNLVNYLRSTGEAVITYDIKQNPWEDITNYENLHSIFNAYNPSEVYHLAAQAFVGPGEKDPYADLRINGYGMINILKCTKEFDCKLLFTSSGAVYGLTDSFPAREDASLFPVANYGCTKLLAEYYLRKWVLTDGIDAKIVRFSSVYGLGRGREGPVNTFIEKALDGETLTVFGDGSQTRDMVHVIDAIRGMTQIMKSGASGQAYNIGLGEEHSVLEVAQEVSSLTGARIEMVPKALSKFDVSRSYYNISKARKVGYSPEIPLKHGIKLVLDGTIKARFEVLPHTAHIS
jgi:UDP-glucose 4-epimerase